VPESPFPSTNGITLSALLDALICVWRIKQGMFPRGSPTFRCVVTIYEYRVRKRLEKKGIPFKAQEKIRTVSGRAYRVDIFLPPRLVVEIGHVGFEDLQEDEDLKASGYTVLRFKNVEVRKNLAGVVQQIQKARIS
jgi:very-short-patch-repair endonuclease